MNPQTPTDDELWHRARDGDEQAFGALFDRHARTVYNFCFRQTASWSEAQDATSVVFLETWRQRGRVQPRSGSLLPWLYGVATNVLHNQRRSMRRHRNALSRMPKPVPHPDDADEVAARLDAEQRMRRVLEAVRKLPRRDREVLVLSVWEELDHSQIAEALGIAPGTVRSRLSRARARLRDLTPDTLPAAQPNSGRAAEPEPKPEPEPAHPRASGTALGGHPQSAPTRRAEAASSGRDAGKPSGRTPKATSPGRPGSAPQRDAGAALPTGAPRTPEVASNATLGTPRTRPPAPGEQAGMSARHVSQGPPAAVRRHVNAYIQEESR